MSQLRIIILLSLLFYNSIADNYVVVSNTKMKGLSKMQIRAIFLKKIKIINGINVVPLNLSPNNNLRVNFEKNILKMSFSSLKSYWTSRHYLGHRPPLSMKSQKSVIAFIKRIDGSLGYIEEKNIDKDLKVLYRWKK